MAGYSPAKVDRTQLLQDQDLQDNSNLARKATYKAPDSGAGAGAALGWSTSSWSEAQQAQKQQDKPSAGMTGTEGHSNLARTATGYTPASNLNPDYLNKVADAVQAQQSAFTNQLKGIQTSGYAQMQSRIPVTREDLIEVALKLQEAASLITQAISRLGAR